MRAFNTWLDSAKAKDQFTYHIGPHYTGRYPLEDADKTTVLEVRKAYNEGLIEIVQKRLDHRLEYIAIRRRHKAVLPDPFKFSSNHLKSVVASKEYAG